MSNILEVKALTFKYKGKDSISVLDNMNDVFSSGKLYAILGSSGSGKSTYNCF
ncbi:hypothetical protein [Hespellia stercorisuis]|uniref:Putative ABC transport system ATP-binding protein/energy-coupling factor transport system ATP-binding protein n=1 Tax=Hespellia stercorisuis DSM 15480 TaxID=1121950 RepID=A0A1M6IAU3_9FIRM|nr:hypothetical protein [Hespellia stercorisuis]SHJ31523.1 putative ABC transport system ATP-binding protein/energy-coupling factor transport system ATP-binding protein [Hespellia stercorisuis DSM 15480]